MQNKFFRIFLITLYIFLFSSLAICSASGFTLDDRSPELSYSGRTTYFVANAYNGSVSRISYQASLTFDFYGDELTLYAVTYTNSAPAAVYIDGVSRGHTLSIGTSRDFGYPVMVFDASGLSAGSHICTIIPDQSSIVTANGTTSSGAFFLDKIELAKSNNTESFYQLYIMIGLSVLICLTVIPLVIKFVLWRLYPDD